MAMPSTVHSLTSFGARAACRAVFAASALAAGGPAVADALALGAGFFGSM
jgi:hypothetical protein